ncbi:MAG: cytochrome c [Acidobacteriota bacterium]|nr:cytochrome c [Acidobacteriota bacterium]
MLSYLVRRRAFFYCLLLTAYCLLAAGCRQDMQDQPRYEAYEASDGKFFADGQSSRPLIAGTVARGHLRENTLLYTGQPGAGQTGGGGVGQVTPAAGATTGGVPTGNPNLNSSGTTGAQLTGDVNVRGNTAGGVPGAAAVQRPPGQTPGAAGANSATAGPDVWPFQITEADLRRGQERFNAFCVMCHGMTGEGDGMVVRRGFRKPPSFHSEQLLENNSSSAHLFDVITNGWGAMPDYASMIPPEDRWRIIAYVRALQLSQRAKIEDVPADKRNSLQSGGAAQPPHGNGQTPPGGAHQ